MVFAKETTDGLTSLVKKLDAATAKHTTDKVGSFVVFCSDDKDLETKLKKLAETQKIEHTVLTIDNPADPQAASRSPVTSAMRLRPTKRKPRSVPTRLTAA